jgi:acyl-CoA thioester hydrolase
MNEETRNNGQMASVGVEAAASEFRLRVRYAETDRMGVVYHAHYLIWCEAGRTELMRQAGYPYTRMEEKGFSLAVADASLRYHASARYDEEIIVRTTVRRVRSRTVEFDYLVLNAATGTRLVSASTTLICLGPEGGVVAIPADVRALLESRIA